MILLRKTQGFVLGTGWRCEIGTGTGRGTGTGTGTGTGFVPLLGFVMSVVSPESLPS